MNKLITFKFSFNKFVISFQEWQEISQVSDSDVFAEDVALDCNCGWCSGPCAVFGIVLTWVDQWAETGFDLFSDISGSDVDFAVFVSEI